MFDQEPPKREIVFRPEQREAIDLAKHKFNQKTGKQFLWNAKMRFGKTLCALEVAKEQEYKSILIVTHRPVVDKGWSDDFDKIFPFPFKDRNGNQLTDYYYATRMDSDEEKDAESKPNHIQNMTEAQFRSLRAAVNNGKKNLVLFVSMQYLRLSELVGGENPEQLKKDIMQYDWDFVVVDEAHEGTQTNRGQGVLEQLKKENTRVLYLSGTPFNLFDDFKEEEIYTWDYVREQQAKHQWDKDHCGDHNPYAVLPHMNIFTYQLSEILHDNEDENHDFKFNEFFRTWTGEYKKDKRKMPADAKIGEFIYKNEVRMFLDLLIENREESNYPFSTDEFRDKFRHTFWIIPGVKEGAALESMLNEHPIFRQFKVINVAGDGNAEDDKGLALKAVQKGIKENPYTITLSCGKLTTGVSVPQWTAVFYLKGSENTPASTYMQTIFRVQTHAVLDGRQKTEAYVFDFAPSRALRVLAETAKMAIRSQKGDDEEKKKKSKLKLDHDEEVEQLEEFLSFCPVISLKGSSMVPYDANTLFAQLEKVYVERAVRSGYGDNSIYDTNYLMNFSEEELNALEGVFKKIGKTTNMKKPDDVHIGQKPIDEETNKKAKVAAKKKKEGKELTPDEIAALAARKAEQEEKRARISVLRGISIRIPLLVYGAEIADEDKELTIDNFTQLVDDASWAEFMPADVSKDEFNLLKKAYDGTIFQEAGKRIRSLARAADQMDVEERINRISTIFSYFHNPDKETVLTPWRVVNMHMSDCLGGWCFYNEQFDDLNTVKEIENGSEVQYYRPRFVDRGKVTHDIFENYDARILEINSKTGLYPLYMAYSLYQQKVKAKYAENGLDDKEDYNQVIWDQIISDNIFVICKTPMAVSITKRTLVGFRNVKRVNAKCYTKTIDSKVFDLISILQYDPKIFNNDVINPINFWNIKDSTISRSMLKFSAIVGNPPYQIMDGGNGGSSTPIYNKFVEVASKLEPLYSSLIIPARWTTGGKGLKNFRENMISDKHIVVLHDFFESKKCFPTVEIEGGVCYYLRDSENEGKCKVITQWGNGRTCETLRYLQEEEYDIFIRDGNAISILKKVTKKKGFVSFGDKLVHSRNYFGLTSFPNIASDSTGKIKILGLENRKRVWKYVDAYNNSSPEFDKNMVTKHKVFASKADGAAGQLCNPVPARIIGNGEYGSPHSVCTETFLAIGPFETANEAKNVLDFMKTKFFRFLVGIRKLKNMSQDTYSFVPVLDFKKSWNDQSLFKEYDLDSEEVKYIESMISSME